MKKMCDYALSDDRQVSEFREACKAMSVKRLLIEKRHLERTEEIEDHRGNSPSWITQQKLKDIEDILNARGVKVCQRCGNPLTAGPGTEDETGLCPGCLASEMCET